METTSNAPPEIATRLRQTIAALRELGVADEAATIGAEAGATVGELTQDTDLALATALHSAQHEGFHAEEQALAHALGPEPIRLAAQLARLGELGLAEDWSTSRGLNTQQAETVRNMLLAMADDPRLVVARLAEQLVRLRHARALPAAVQQRLAVETREIFAPLANRLGIWNLKWELEDQAFRYLDADGYRRIAGALSERRIDRQRYIQELCELLQRELAAAGIRAQVYGRPKHIYSIWRKMQRKHVDFEQVFDVRAVRIVVASVADCYAVLGIVHGLWRYLPGEFDDYIATPKGNAYRSIHTAVIGPESKPVEIQIRTGDMHEHAELGVAAHWRYKEGGARDLNYERKIEWVRRLLDPAQFAETEADFIDSIRAGLFTDRTYALTPRGEVVDLPRGATALDFAYHLHTDLGHRCRGAKANGRIITLTQPLANGDVVEIITTRHGAPSRDWLSPEQGFLVSARSRAKVRAWFRRHDQPGTPEIPAAVAPPEPPESDGRSLARRRTRTAAARSPVQIEGVGDLPTTMARCCAPVPPEPIAGYLTLGRGVTIHRDRCRNLLRMRTVSPQRVLRVEWNRESGSRLPVQIRVEAFDRRGLLRDITDVMALERLSIDGVNSNTDPDDRIATIVMRTAVHDSEQLARVLQRLGGVPNVLHAQRQA